MAFSKFAKTKLTIDAVSWTALVSTISFRKGWYGTADPVNAVKVRTASGDATTEQTLTPGVMETIEGNYGSGETIAFFQAVSGTGPVILTQEYQR